MATTAITSPLTQDSDFASELLLNRVMNGQAEAQSGMTVTAANRALASKFDAAGYSYNVLAENVAEGMTIVDTTQNALTELLSQVKRFGELVSSAEDSSMATELAKSMQKNFDAILDTESHGVRVLQNAGKEITMGENFVLGSNGVRDVLPVGNVDIANSSGAFGTLYDAITSSSVTADNAMDYANDAVDQILGAIAKEGARHQILSNRYTMLNDLASTYHKASDDEAKQNVASDYTLLNVVS
ncbi:MAG: hypothetical protein IJU76_00545 [Desulfovibrionaceae bacterium]|nr:hypothetical protein [Desulfovibrionaceae bacterium]